MDVIRELLSSASRIGAHESDAAEIRLQKTILVGVTFLVILSVLLYAGMYLRFQEPLAALTSFGYIVIALAGLYYFHTTRNYRLFLISQMIAGLLLPFLQSLALGDFLHSGGVILWSLMTPVGALFLDRPHSAYRWWAAYLGLIVLTGVLQPYLRASNHLPHWLIGGLFVLNVSGVSSIVILTLVYFVNIKDQILELLKLEQEKSENLLLNILPREIAAILKNEQRTIADQYSGASVLFADLVGFTPLTAQMAPVEMVTLLNDIFSHFDSLVEKYDLEKIRTIGDSYMVASGVPRPRPDHARAIACLALDSPGTGHGDSICPWATMRSSPGAARRRQTKRPSSARRQ
jgi:guanylate cyclase